jgi:hypothetical protein
MERRRPKIRPGPEDPGEDRKLFTLMKKLRLANEYVRHEKSLFCVRDIAGD